MNVIRIDDLSHPGVAPYAGLTEAQLRNRLHPEEGLFVCESAKVIGVALAAGCVPVSFLSEEKHLLRQVEPLTEGWPEVPVYTASRAALQSLTGYELSRGVLCAMRRPRAATVEEVCRGARRVVVMDNVVNSTNTGAVFRAAAALGADGVLLTRRCCDPLNRRACRVSMGTVFQLPWGWMESYDELRTCGFRLAALALRERSVAPDDPRLKAEERLAIVVGTEGDGLPDEVIDGCDYVVKIPMHRGVDSLNVAAAASVAFYEMCR